MIALVPAEQCGACGGREGFDNTGQNDDTGFPHIWFPDLTSYEEL